MYCRSRVQRKVRRHESNLPPPTPCWPVFVTWPTLLPLLTPAARSITRYNVTVQASKNNALHVRRGPAASCWSARRLAPLHNARAPGMCSLSDLALLQAKLRELSLLVEEFAVEASQKVESPPLGGTALQASCALCWTSSFFRPLGMVFRRLHISGQAYVLIAPFLQSCATLYSASLAIAPPSSCWTRCRTSFCWKKMSWAPTAARSAFLTREKS